MPSTPALVVNRIKHSPASGYDLLALQSVCLTITMTGSITPGEEKAAIAAAIEAGVGLDPAHQHGGKRPHHGGGWESLAVIGRRIWKDSRDHKELTTRTSQYVRRLQGFPNPSGMAWFSALVCVVAGGNRRNHETKQVKGVPSRYVVTTTTRAVLAPVPHSLGEAQAGATFRTHDAKGKLLPGRKAGMVGWDGEWTIDKSWALAVTALATKEADEEIADNVDEKIAEHEVEHGGRYPTKAWIAAQRARFTAEVEASWDNRIAEVTAYLAQARQEQETLSAHGLRLEGWHPNYQPVDWEDPWDVDYSHVDLGDALGHSPATPVAEQAPAVVEPVEVEPVEVEPVAVEPAAVERIAVEPAKPRYTGPAIRQPGDPEPCDWTKYVPLGDRSPEDRAAAIAEHGQPFAGGRAALVTEFLTEWLNDHSTAQPGDQLRGIIANAIWPGGIGLTEDQLRWVGRRLGTKGLPWSEKMIRIEMRGWENSAERVLAREIARKAGGENAQTGEDRWADGRAKAAAGVDPWA